MLLFKFRIIYYFQLILNTVHVKLNFNDKFKFINIIIIIYLQIPLPISIETHILFLCDKYR